MAPVAGSACRPAWMARVAKPLSNETMSGPPVRESWERLLRQRRRRHQPEAARAVASFATGVRDQVFKLRRRLRSLPVRQRRQHPGRAFAWAGTFALFAPWVPFAARARGARCASGRSVAARVAFEI